MPTIRLAALQSSFTDDVETNVARITQLVRDAASDGAQIILPPELFEGRYFPQTQNDAEASDLPPPRMI